MQIKKISMTVLTFLAIAGLQQWALADNDPGARLYTVKQSTAPVGTNFKRDIVKVGTIPLNKSFDELSDAQKQTLRDAYDHMPTSDEPPFPEKGLFSIYKAIANAHEETEYENAGVISIEVLVDSNGTPKSADVVSSPSEEITNAAVYAAMHTKYKPAICGGQPCSMKFPIHAELIAPTDLKLLKNFSTPGVTLSH